MFLLYIMVHLPVIPGEIMTQLCCESPKHVSLSFMQLINAFIGSLNPSTLEISDIMTVAFHFKNALLFIQVFIRNLLIVCLPQFTFCVTPRI